MHAAGLTCFDISTFNSRLNSVDDFVRSLRRISNQDSDRHHKFEEVLRYAAFPSLDNNQWDTDDEKTHREVFDTLAWLVKRKGVKRVLSIEVLDRMHRPHDERGIAMWARLLGAERLDWRYLDMAISYLTDGDMATPSYLLSNDVPHLQHQLKIPKERLKELCLYSSGKMAAVDHWLGPNGVRTLPNVSISVKPIL
jgi:hypothetical protein